MLSHAWHEGWGCSPEDVDAPPGTLLLPPATRGPLLHPRLLCPRTGPPCFPAHGGLLLSFPSGVLGLKPSPSLFLLILNKTRTAPCSGSWQYPTAPPNPWQKQELKLLSPSTTPQNLVSGEARDSAGVAVGKGSASVLTGDTLAFSPESHQQQGEQGQGEDLHVQPGAWSAPAASSSC